MIMGARPVLRWADTAAVAALLVRDEMRQANPSGKTPPGFGSVLDSRAIIARLPSIPLITPGLQRTPISKLFMAGIKPGI